MCHHFYYRRYFRAHVCWQEAHKHNEEYINPVTLQILQTDETTIRAVQLFARQVVLILNTCNVNKYWAALKRLDPPTKGDGSTFEFILWPSYPQVGSVIGWFAGYRAAVVRTGRGTNVVMNWWKPSLNHSQMAMSVQYLIDSQRFSVCLG